MEEKVLELWQQACDLEVTNDLIDKILELDPNAVVANRLGYTLLHFAARCYLHDSITSLLSKGADVNAVNVLFQETPLHIVADRLDLRGCTELLEAGADPTAQDRYGRTPFDVAVTGIYWQEPEIRELVLQILGKAEFDRIIRSTPKIITDRYKETKEP